MKKIAMLGAGTWGLALSRMLSLNHNSVTVWSAIKEEIEELNKTRKAKKLNDMVLPEDIIFTDNI